MTSRRDLHLGWLRGEIRRYEHALTLFADDSRADAIAHCLRGAYLARHRARRQRW